MTTSRIVRGTKIRIFLCFCAAVVVLGLLVCYNNTVSQLDETQKAVKLCHQLQENLSTQLQVISDYKLRLEKALTAEKSEHEKSNNTFHQAIVDQKTKHEKNALDEKLRFNSLQQSYNLLQTEHNDYKEKSSKTEQEQLEEIIALKNQLKELQKQKDEVTESKEKLKTEYMNLIGENDNLKRQLEGAEHSVLGNDNKTNYLTKQNIELRQEIEKLKDRCPDIPDTNQLPMVIEDPPNQDQKQNQQMNQNVLALPNNEVGNAKSSSTPSGSKSSQGSLNGARPLALPTMTPKNINLKNADILPIPNSNKLPQGVPIVPEKIPEGVVAADRSLEDNEIPNDIIDNRYKNKIEEVKRKKHEEMERENGAHEIFDAQNLGNEGFGFGDPIKQAEKNSINGQHIDKLALYKEGGARNEGLAVGDYKEHDQMEENAAVDEGDDGDQDEYDYHLDRHKEPAVRN